MKSAAIISFALSITLLLASIAICVLGVEYEVGKIPPEVRAGMSDTDWVGVEWIARGMILFFIAVLMTFTGTALLIFSVKTNKTKIAQD